MIPPGWDSLANPVSGRGLLLAIMAHAKRLTVLIEDDMGMRQALVRVLSGAGYPVMEFETAEALLDVPGSAAIWTSCGCLVCDVRLPGISGFELQRRIADKVRILPWIFITAHDDPSVLQQARRISASLLLKPFEGRTLLALLDRLTDPRGPDAPPIE